MAELETVPKPVDPRPRRLLERYAALVGGLVMESAPDLLQLELPANERRILGLAQGVNIALTPAALDEDPEAEILVVGSALLDRLIKAVRLRGGRDDRGLLPPAVPPDAAAPDLGIPVDGAEIHPAETELISLPVGRLIARVTIHAGPLIEERLVESSIVDLSIGAVVTPELAAACERQTASEAGSHPGARPVAPRSGDKLLPLLFADLERGLEPELAKMRAQAERDCAAEVARLDGYYQRMVEEVDPEEDSNARERKDAIQAQQARRKLEEETRHQVRATVHPIHLVEWRVLCQRSTWELRTPGGHHGSISSTRALSGDTAWRTLCPNCGQTPSRIDVCQGDHVVCARCGDRCTVCGEAACHQHGLLRCTVEGHPVCRSHGATCSSCDQVHCPTHSARCEAADHEVCSTCARQCARCGKPVCSSHATRTSQGSPKGSRWLCSDCTVLCEGGSNEPVGLDEAVRCTSCSRHICQIHQVECAVDGQAHCSRHLRRSDASGRLVCEQHRAACAKEPMEVLASDEIFECRTCAARVCIKHSAECYLDRERHCVDHLAPVADLRGKDACTSHRSVCQVDGVSFSLTGTAVCPVCTKPACSAHRRTCGHCGRIVCSRDLDDRRCLTGRKLKDASDPPDDLITAALAANDGDPPSTRGWRMARDATHTVVELDLGWLRELVFAVAHGDTTPATVMSHGLLGSRRRR